MQMIIASCAGMGECEKGKGAAEETGHESIFPQVLDLYALIQPQSEPVFGETWMKLGVAEIALTVR